MAKAAIIRPHDKFFRAAMGHKSVAIDFFKGNLPIKIQQSLNMNSLALIQQSYIDNKLQETISDLVFSCELADKPAYLTLLVEHQSSSDPMMPFRVHHYIFGMLHSYRKQHPKKLLPAVYAVVFYHGEKVNGHTLNLWECFDDPLNLMPDILYNEINVVDVNEISDKKLSEQPWAGPMARALKHIRQKDMTPYALDILRSILWPLDNHEGMDLLQLLLNYLLRVGNIEDVDTFIDISTKQLSGLMRSEVMTFAETLEERGIQKGREQGIQKGREQGIQKGREEGIQKVALTMLKEGVDAAFIIKTTGLSLQDIERLNESLRETVKDSF
jgi:recombination-promoting nuclease RpnB